jgi:hypothetical protein
MSFVARERDRLDAMYRSMQDGDARRAALHAARQSLCWALEPEGFASPSKSILRDNLVDLKDCPESSYPASS